MRAVLLFEGADALLDFLETNRIRVPHRAAAISREAVAVDVDDVDIDSSEGNAFFQNLGPFVDESVEGALHDFVRCDPAPRNPCLSSALLDELLSFRIGEHCAAAFFVAIPAAAGLLAKAAHLTQPVGH